VANKSAEKSPSIKEFTAEMVEALTPVGDVRSRLMFGGYGIFENGTMFALIDSKGSLFFRADSSTKSRYIEAGSKQHNPMPYFEVPDAVADDYSEFIEWAKQAAQIAHSAKKK
jgi:DNA transformation protein